MPSWIAYEGPLRLAVFCGVLAAMMLWEWRVPLRSTVLGWRRWPANLGLVVVDALVVRLLFPTAAVGLALWAQANHWGLLPLTDWPLWLQGLLAFVALDFVVYLQHVMFHAVPALWRLHRVHHVDTEFDATTGLRFHPVEIVLSMLLKLAAVIVIGPPALAVMLFEIVLNGSAMFNHGNVTLPPLLDRVLRWFIVTPDMHRVHHSIEAAETNSNFGFNLTWWDRLFGTYTAQPKAGQRGMAIGLDVDREPSVSASLPRLLLLPFRQRPDHYSIGRRFNASEPEQPD